MADLKGLCMACRVDKKPTMQIMKDAKVSEKNNRFSAKGKCGKCGGNMFKFLSKEDAQAIK